MRDDFFGKTHCDRCGADLRIHVRTMSRFNQDAICVACEADEKLAPGYKRAAEVELAHVRDRDYNYPGVGLGAEDLAFLAECRANRAKTRV